MQLKIESSNLIDYPYDPKQTQYHELFFFDQAKVENLVSEILYASPTCYLIAGYRGSGKTSFIKKVQQECRSAIDDHISRLADLNKLLLSADKGNGPYKEIKGDIEAEQSRFQHENIVFVYSSFSRYENQTFFLRKIIRDLQETVLGLKLAGGTEAVQNLGSLYQKTIYEVKQERATSLETETHLEFSLEINDFIKKLLLQFAPFLVPFISETILSPFWGLIEWSGFAYVKSILYIILFAIGIISTLKFAAKYSIKKTYSEKTSETSLDDDNITEYELDAVIDKFISLKYKLVFVLDELDKVEEDDQAKLLNEMKPWLVRGKADFIIVAGQKLTMKYYQLKDKDDEVMVSLFSKIVHIGLLPEEGFRKIFFDFLIVNIAKENNKSAFVSLSRSVCDSFIYRSKRIPRTFMNLVRQSLQWRDGKAFLSVHDEGYKSDEVKISIIRGMSEELYRTANIPETEKEHLLMQLFRAAGFITEDNWQSITIDELINEIIYFGNKKQGSVYTYANLQNLLENKLKEFYKLAVDAKLIATPADEGFTNGQFPSNKISISIEEQRKQKELDQFKNDFNSFIGLLQRTVVKLIPDRPDLVDANRSISEYLAAFDEKNIFVFKKYDSELFKPALSHYTSRANNSPDFKLLKGFFEENNLDLTELFQSVSHYYFRDTLGQNINVERLQSYIGEKLNLPNRVDNYFIASREENGGKVTALFEYIFLNEAVEISGEEINRSISILDTLNLELEMGCYYIPVLFYKSSSGTDDAQQAISANYTIEKSRPELKGKITYIVLSIYNLGSVNPSIHAVANRIKPYSTTPMLNPKYKPLIHKPRTIDSSLEASGTNPNDPQKGMWGGSPISKGKKLSAKVTSNDDSVKSFNITLIVESISDKSPLLGKVTFYLHHSFIPDKYTVIAKDNKAVIKNLINYEAFTIGVTCDNNVTRLELDLNELEDLPDGFRKI